MSKLVVTFEHLDYGMRKRVAAELAEKDEQVEAVMERLIHDGAKIELVVVIEKPAKKKEKKVEKAVKKVVKNVKKNLKKKK